MFVFSLAAFAYAGTARTSADFLLENLSARLEGMGGAFTASAENADSINTNPAGMLLLNRPEAYFSYAAGQDNSSNGFAAYVHPLRADKPVGFAFGTGVLYYTAGNIDINTSAGTTRSYNAEKGYSGTVAFGARMGRIISLGISPKFVRSTLVEQYTASSYALDAGVMVFPFPEALKERLIIGGAVQNLGGKMAYKTVEADLPRTESVGVSYRFFDNLRYGTLLLSGQVEQTLGETWRYRSGVEYLLGGLGKERVLALRGGYLPQYTMGNYTLGIGLRERNLEIDYSFVSGMTLDNTHRISVTFRFGKVIIDRDEERADNEDLRKELNREYKYDLDEKTEGKSGEYQLIHVDDKPKKDILKEKDKKPDDYQYIPEMERDPDLKKEMEKK